MKAMPCYVYMLNKCILPESRVLQQQSVSANGYQMHEILPAHLLPSMFLEGQEPQFTRQAILSFGSNSVRQLFMGLTLIQFERSFYI